MSISVNAQVDNMNELFEALYERYDIPISEEDKTRLADKKWKIEGYKLETIMVDSNDSTIRDVPIKANEMELEFEEDNLFLTEYVKKKKLKDEFGEFIYTSNNCFERHLSKTKKVLGYKTEVDGDEVLEIRKDSLNNYAYFLKYSTFATSGKPDSPIYTEVKTHGTIFVKLID